MASEQYLRASYAEVSSFLDNTAGSVPTAATTWTLIPNLDKFDDKPDVKFDEAIETSTDGSASYPEKIADYAEGSFEARIYTGSKYFDGTGGSADPTSFYLQKLVENFFGAAAHAAFTGTTISGGAGTGNTTPIALTSVTGLVVGDMIMINGEVAIVLVISSLNVTTDHDFATVPSAADKVYGGFNFKPTLGEYSKYLYFLVERDGHSRLEGPARVTSIKVNTAAGEAARYAFSFMANQWTTGFTPNAAPTDTFRREIMKGMNNTSFVGGSATRLASWSCDLGLSQDKIIATSGTNGVAGFQETENLGIGGELAMYFADSNWTSWKAQTNLPSLLMTMGISQNAAAKPGGTLAVYVDRAFMKLTRAPINKQVGEKWAWSARRPASAGISAVHMCIFGGE